MSNLKMIQAHLASKEHGLLWLIDAAELLVRLMKSIDESLKEEEEATRDLKKKLENIKAPFAIRRMPLTTAEGLLRERILKEYEAAGGVPSIAAGGGEIVFSKRDSFKITDEAKLPRDLLVINPQAINQLIKNGVLKGKGWEYDPKVILSVKRGNLEGDK